MSKQDLYEKIYQNILDLATTEGINASGRDEIYGCIFGRDSFITILKILNAYTNRSTSSRDFSPLLLICKRSLLTLTALQGKEVNIQSGEEPGKFIHEYRKEKYSHLLNREKPWYLYPDNILRNYDSLDSTPLGLIALYTYWHITQDDAFLVSVLPAVEKALRWITKYGDRDMDMLLEYEVHKDRTYGGLVVQSWTDSRESLLQEDGSFPLYPIAPVEVQGYAWLSLMLWSDFFLDKEKSYQKKDTFGKKLRSDAIKLKKHFNNSFLFQSGQQVFLAQALDGSKKQIRTITGNPLLLLWATYKNNGSVEALIDEEVIGGCVKRSFLPDMFDPDAGIRTMSTESKTFNPGNNSYHNGSFWPILNGMIHEGLMNWGYREEAKILRSATLKPILYFGSPIEVYIKDTTGAYQLYKNARGQECCKYQAWSAAVALDLLM